MNDSCPLCIAVKNEKSLYEDDHVVILETKNKKGHEKRIMVVSKSHIPLETETGVLKYTHIFIDFCIDYFDEPTFCLMEGTYSIIRNHWHLVACDWRGHDTEQMLYTPHRAIPTNKR